MGIYGVGVDIIEISRISKAIEKYPNFIERIYTDREIEYCEGFPREKHVYYAVRFAAKEAIAKSMAQGIGKDMFFKEIELARESSGAPYVRLYGRAFSYQKKLGIKEIKISVSHTRDYAIAFAVSIL